MRSRTSTAGSSENSADTSGEAPTRSPAATTTLFGLCAFSRATWAASASAPPTAGRSGACALLPKRPGDCRLPWKSLNARILTVTAADGTGGGAAVVAQPAIVAASSAAGTRARQAAMVRSRLDEGIIICPLFEARARP